MCFVKQVLLVVNIDELRSRVLKDESFVNQNRMLGINLGFTLLTRMRVWAETYQHQHKIPNCNQGDDIQTHGTDNLSLTMLFCIEMRRLADEDLKWSVWTRQVALRVFKRILLRFYLNDTNNANPDNNAEEEQEEKGKRNGNDNTIINNNLRSVLSRISWSKINISNSSLPNIPLLNKKGTLTYGKKGELDEKFWQTVLPSKVYHARNDDKRNIMMKWIVILRRETMQKSALSLRNTLYHILAYMRYFELDVKEEYTDDELPFCDEVEMWTTRHNAQSIVYLYQWILHRPLNYDNLLLKHHYDKTCTETVSFGDKHVLTGKELDAIYYACEPYPREKLIFLLLITTGMRIGAVVNIRIRDIMSTSTPNIFDVGKTVEKGNRWIEFPIIHALKPLIREWISKHRPLVDSEYLFPTNRNKQITTETYRRLFKNIAKKGGVVGTHVHPHALRHSFARMLLQNDNSISIISKLLNHTSSEITEKFYLKERVSETIARANIPWIKNIDPKLHAPNFIPSFLSQGLDVSLQHNKK